MTRGSFLKMLVLGGGVMAASLVGGCKSNGGSADAPVTVMSADGQTTWVRDSRTGGKIVRTQAEGAKTCAHCESMATAYLNGDKAALKHCAACKGSPTVVNTGGRGMF